MNVSEANGLIPAHAGKTAPRKSRPPKTGAHPRSRGENSAVLVAAIKAPGSSPLTRGKHPTPVLRASARGLIPAHAGKTPGGNTRQTAPTAHPRSRGENGEGGHPGLARVGSSPLTRGKLGNEIGVVQASGLIPAHAGKTRRSSRSWWARTAHPRSRGENKPPTTDSRITLGSSPLTRGKHQTDRVGIHSGGLIPAHAGKTSPWCRPRSR